MLKKSPLFIEHDHLIKGLQQQQFDLTLTNTIINMRSTPYKKNILLSHLIIHDAYRW